MRTRRRLPLAHQLVMVQLLLILAVLVAASAVSVETARVEFARDEGRRVLTQAEVVAANPVIRSTVIDRAGSAIPAVITQVQTVSGVDVVAVADDSGRILESTDPTLVGGQIPWPELAAAPQRGHSATVDLSGEPYLMSAVPIFSDPGEGQSVVQLGVALVGQRSPSRWETLLTSGPTLVTYLGAALVLGVAGSLLLARWIKRGTHGLEPAEIAALAEQREAILVGIAEGIVALDHHERLTFANAPAVRLLRLPNKATGSTLTDLGISGRLHDVLTGVADTESNAVVIRGGRVLVLNRMPVVRRGQPTGSVTTLRDRTEMVELEKALGSFQTTTGLLRAQAHEFANQLHTISGLIQIGDHDEVVTYVQSLVASRAVVDLSVTQRVRDPSVGALLVAKTAQAAENRVELRVGMSSALAPLDPGSAFDVATVIGNLIQNGVDAVVGAAGAPSTSDTATVGWVQVDLHQTGDLLEIVVRDSGPGVPSSLVAEVFEHGFSTKAARGGERGIGLALTRHICRQRGGDVEFRAAEPGTSVAAWLVVETVGAREEKRPVEPVPALTATAGGPRP